MSNWKAGPCRLLGSKRTWHLGWAMFAYARQAEMVAARLSREPTSTGYPASLGTWGGKRLALRPGLRNDPFFGEVYQWAIPKLRLSPTVLLLALFW
jgi:hypothetical protein